MICAGGADVKAALNGFDMDENVRACLFEMIKHLDESLVP